MAKKAEKSKKKIIKKKTTKKKAATKKKAVKKTKKKVAKKAIKAKTSKKTSKKSVKKVAKKTSRGKEPGKTAPSIKRGKEPTTMEELLAQTGYKLKGIKRGELVEGTVTDISRRMTLIDIGSKTEGLVVDKEYEAAKEFISELSIGDKITVYILSPENDRGQILLSLKRAATNRTWNKFEEALKTGEVVSVKGTDVNRGGVIVRADSLQGFVPSSQFGKQWLGKMDELLDITFQVRVIEVNREKNRLIFSEKEVSEAEEIKQRSKALKAIRVGENYEGVVSGIMPFGVFIGVDIPLAKSKVKGQKSKAGKIGRVEGLVHISEISWEKVEDPNRFFRVGDKVKVKVLGIDEKSSKLNLSVKRLKLDPWEEIEKKYPRSKKIRGKVSRVAPFGVFVTLEPGIEGLLHISKIPTGEEPELGSPIEVYVEQIDVRSRRMSLGKVLTEVPVGYK